MKYITQKINLSTHDFQRFADSLCGEKTRLHKECDAAIFALALGSNVQYENKLDM